MSQPRQQHRHLAIATALADDVLVLNRATIHERFNHPFRIEVDLSSTDGNVKYTDVVGHPACIRLELGQHGTRYFHGSVSRLVHTFNQGGYARYSATIVPWLWFLTRTSDCRVFQRKSVVEIAEEIFNGHRFGSEFYELRLKETYAPRRYCVQYRETDFNFVSRLFESEGICYWFEHQEDRDRLVLGDGLQAHRSRPGYESLDFHEVETRGTEGREVVTEWIAGQEVQPVGSTLKDFDFKKPAEPLLSTHEIKRDHGMARFSIYDYPGEYFEPGDADRYARLRTEERQAGQEIFSASTTARGLAVGQVFELKEHNRADQNRKYLITDLTTTVDAGEFASGGASGEYFTCSLRAIPSTTPYRPSRATPKPIIQGIQTATVVGPSGEEIHTDEHARVKVQFHWDRYGKMDENSSCWVRVSQAWAGKGWGAITIPRIGQEVIVEFLEGDPDRPIVTGRVYNAEAMPPYDLPAHATMSAVKSNSSKGGEGFNELRFEDKKGEEQIFVHGEKNCDLRIKNDCFEWIGNDRHLIVKKDQIEKVENNRSEEVTADHMEKIGKDRHLKVVGKEAKEVGGSLSLTVKGDVIEVFKAKHSEQTTNDYYLKADNVVIEGMTNVTLKVGGSSIAIAADGIALKTDGLIKIEASATMDLKADAPLTIKSSATAEMKSPMTTVKGDGMLTLKGGMVMIN